MIESAAMVEGATAHTRGAARNTSARCEDLTAPTHSTSGRRADVPAAHMATATAAHMATATHVATAATDPCGHRHRRGRRRGRRHRVEQTPASR
jgi:hypothetical protein